MPRESKALAVGDAAPDFLLRDAIRGGDYTLGGLLARGPLVLKFQRGTWCPSCRREWEEVREHLTRRQETGDGRRDNVAFVICQKPYSAVSHFATGPDRGRWPFPVLVDDSRATAKAYGVYLPFNFESIRIARPATFVIGTDRRIRWLYVGAHQRDWPPLEAVLKQIQSPQS